LGCDSCCRPPLLGLPYVPGAGAIRISWVRLDRKLDTQTDLDVIEHESVEARTVEEDVVLRVWGFDKPKSFVTNDASDVAY
jgi:hypothetical protein